MKVLAIDPGCKSSGAVLLDGMQVIEAWPEIDNYQLLDVMGSIRFDVDFIAYEMIKNYGHAVGGDVFETCLWAGRFIQAYNGPKVIKVYRQQVKKHLRLPMSANDAAVRQAILRLYEPSGGGKTPQVGTKAQPGPLYGVSKHAWAALGVGLTVIK